MFLTGRLTGMVILLAILAGGCTQQQLAPPEFFTVQGTLQVTTVDTSGAPISAPVTFIADISTDSPDHPEGTSGSVILQSDENGSVTFSRRFQLQSGQSAWIMADVSTPGYQSVNYWTAYFHPSDAPARQYTVQVVVISQ